MLRKVKRSNTHCTPLRRTPHIKSDLTVNTDTLHSDKSHTTNIMMLALRIRRNSGCRWKVRSRNETSGLNLRCETAKSRKII